MTRAAMVVSGVVSGGTGSGGATGGAVLGESTRATRATPPGETMVYPGDVASNTVESGIPRAHDRAWDPAPADAVRTGAMPVPA
jgi:hypothetical protein